MVRQHNYNISVSVAKQHKHFPAHLTATFVGLHVIAGRLLWIMYTSVYYLRYIYYCAASEISVCQHVSVILSISTNGMLDWTPDESASSCNLLSQAHLVLSLSFPADPGPDRADHSHLITVWYDARPEEHPVLINNKDVLPLMCHTFSLLWLVLDSIQLCPEAFWSERLINGA